MKKTIAWFLLTTSFPVMAGQTTLILSDEEVSGNTKYCFYSNANYDKVIQISASRQCPYTKTFSTDDDDE